MTATRLRVVEWSTGTVGRHAIAGILARPELELAGVWVSSAAKHGQDVGLLASLAGPLGLTATSDRDALLRLRPDCIVHTAMTDDRPLEAVDDLVAFLEAGINVVSSGPVFLQYPAGVLSPAQVQRIDAAGRAGNASLLVTGIDPGFANDVLPLALTSLSRRIDAVRVSEIADYSTYDQPVVNGVLFGFGTPMDQVPLLFRPGMPSLAWGSVVRILAAGLDVELDDLVESVEFVAADRDVSTVSGPIPAGTRAAVRFTVAGVVDGVERIVLEHVTRTGPGQAPHWPRPSQGGGVYRVEVQGDPTMTLELAHHGEGGGDHNVSGMVMTAMRLVNCVEAVCGAKPGLITALDLPLVTGRGLIPRRVRTDVKN